MVKQVRPSVVRIETSSGSGTGIIFDKQGQTGYVITNQHVIEGQAQIDVTVDDSAAYSGTVLGIDRVRDLAVVRICCGSFQELAFGDATSLDPGAEVINVGYALGIPGPASITKGIVSALRWDSRFESWVIQTDAPINPGNSGGPMLSSDGKVVGINTFKISETSVEGLGFAISETTVQERIPALRTATARATPTPTRLPTATPSARAGSALGPSSGELWHDPSDGSIEAEYANVSIADTVVEAIFVNPYSASSASWDYGFFIRNSTGVTFLAVVTSEREWVVQKKERDGSSTGDPGSGWLQNIATGAGARNHLRIVAIGTRGWLFVNGGFVSSIDLSAITGEGDVSVITGAFTGNEVDGAVTRYENFQVGGVTKRYGPGRGYWQEEPGKIVLHDSGVWARDFVVEADFTAPRGTESIFGLNIRQATGTAESINVSYWGEWKHLTWDSQARELAEVTSGPLPAALQNPNHLLIIAIGESGWFFVNGRLVSKLDLSHNQSTGTIRTFIQVFRENQRGSPGFENFNVWTP